MKLLRQSYFKAQQKKIQVCTDTQTECNTTEAQERGKLDRNYTNSLDDNAGNGPDNMDFDLQLYLESVIKTAEAEILQSLSENNHVNSTTETQCDTNEEHKIEILHRNDSNNQVCNKKQIESDETAVHRDENLDRVDITRLKNNAGFNDDNNDFV